MAPRESDRGSILAGWFIVVLGSFLVAGSACRKPAPPGGPSILPLAVDVRVDKTRPGRGETVLVSVTVSSPKPLRGLKVGGRAFVPTRGAADFELRPDGEPAANEARFRGAVSLDFGSPEGIYALTVEAVRGGEAARGKATFLLGKVIADFAAVSAFPDDGLEADLRSYYEDFRKTGGNLVIIHDFITRTAFYPSRVCAKAAAPGSADDKVTVALRLAEEFGLTTLLTAAWDMTRPMPYADCPASTKEVIADLWDIYGSSPALAGFYGYQEGSGTYLAAQMRDFAGAVKALDRGLLTACAPYIDDPLLAGYLASIDDLDIVIYQGAVMASFRPDNRKCFPPRRTKDFTSLSAGATRARAKITISHVELFGYLEKRVAGLYLASPEDIRAQILSAATAFGPDGISFFNYYYCIHRLGKSSPAVAPSRLAVLEAMTAYNLIARSAADVSSRIGVYIPYSDWWTDRWTNAIVPALDGLRTLGVSPDVLPFIPPTGEEILPYYPLHLNREQLAFLKANAYVLVLPDIGGFQDTDGLLIKEFVESGGRVVMFGRRVPYARTYDRDRACGGTENAVRRHTSVRVVGRLPGRVKEGTVFRFEAIESASWTPAGGRAVAVFEDGTAAALANPFGRGMITTVPMNLEVAARVMPGLVRSLLDEALDPRGAGVVGSEAGRPFDVAGLAAASDIAMSTAGCRRVVAVVNHGGRPADIDLHPLGLDPAAVYTLTDLKTGRVVRAAAGRELERIALSVPGLDYVCLSLAKPE